MDEWSELWKEAGCKDQDNIIFFLRKTEDKAKAFCADCPIKSMCLEYALVYNTYGVWGGLSYNERKRKYPSDFRENIREDYREVGAYNRRLKL